MRNILFFFSKSKFKFWISEKLCIFQLFHINTQSFPGRLASTIEIRRELYSDCLYYTYVDIRQINNIDFLSEVSTVHQFVYTDEALLLVRQ